MLCGNVWDFVQEGMNEGSRNLVQVKQKEIIPPALCASCGAVHSWMQWMIVVFAASRENRGEKGVGLNALLTFEASLTLSLYLCC